MHLLSLLMIVSVGLTSALTPVISNFTRPANVAEDPTVESKMTEIKPTTNPTSVTACTVVSFPNGPFSAQRKGGDTNFWVYYDATSDLDYDIDSFYQLKITCTDGIDVSKEQSLFVYIQPNVPPKIKNYPSDPVTLNAFAFSYAADTVYDLVASDPEGDTLTYTLSSQQPNIGLFKLDTQPSPKVKATRDLRSITEPSFVLNVGISDGKNTIDDFKVLVTIDNLNTSPVIRNLPSVVSVPENAPAGTALIKLSVEDAPPNSATLVPTCNTFPAADDSKFQYSSASSSITITGNNLLDYESKDTYTITCSLNDGFLSSDGNDKLTINVENVIEGLTFNSNDYDCALTEGAIRKSYCTLPVTITDLDGYDIDTVTFVSSSGSDNFYYDKDTQRVYLNAEYDVDNNAMPSSVDLVLKAQDSGGSTATASVHITISDANDNTCRLDKDVSYTKIDQSTPLGILDSFTFPDGDLTSPNNAVDTKVVSANPPDSVNYIAVSNTGVVSYIASIPAANSGSSYTMVVSCQDGGVPARSSFATVIVSYTVLSTSTISTPSTTSTTTAKDENIFKYPWFIAVFALLMLCLLAGLIGLTAFLLYKCCYQKMSVEAPRNKITPSEYSNSRVGSDTYSKKTDDNISSVSPRDNIDYAHSWQNNQILSPRQIPALEYK